MYKLKIQNITIASKQPTLDNKIDVTVLPKEIHKNPFLLTINNIYDLYNLFTNTNNSYMLGVGNVNNDLLTVYVNNLDNLQLLTWNGNEWVPAKKEG